MRTGIFGGSFNPVHIGHICLAERMSEIMKLDRLFIIPAGVSPFKENNGGISDSDRLNMCRIAFGNHDNFFVSDIEIKRAGKSYTVDTVRELKKMYPGDDMFLFVGSDMLLSFDKWKDYNIILDNVTLCAVSRESGICSDKLREYARLVIKRPEKITVCSVSMPEISSTEIRLRVKNGRDISNLVSEDVKEYIERRGLYREKQV